MTSAWAPAVGHTVEIRWVPRSTNPYKNHRRHSTELARHLPVRPASAPQRLAWSLMFSICLLSAGALRRDSIRRCTLASDPHSFKSSLSIQPRRVTPFSSTNIVPCRIHARPLTIRADFKRLAALKRPQHALSRQPRTVHAHLLQECWSTRSSRIRPHMAIDQELGGSSLAVLRDFHERRPPSPPEVKRREESSVSNTTTWRVASTSKVMLQKNDVP